MEVVEGSDGAKSPVESRHYAELHSLNCFWLENISGFENLQVH